MDFYSNGTLMVELKQIYKVIPTTSDREHNHKFASILSLYINHHSSPLDQPVNGREDINSAFCRKVRQEFFNWFFGKDSSTVQPQNEL